LVLLPFRSPAPLIYTPGEGWVYEPVGGGGKWQRTRAKDQLIVAQDAFDKKDFSTALRAANRTVKVWPLSDYTPQAQYLIGRCYEEKGYDERAFKEYQKLVEKYPKAINYDDVLKRQFEIANRFLAGEWFRIWGYVPFFPSMEKTADLYGKIVKNGPYSDIAPQAQLKIGEAREKQSNYPLAVKAYERAADRYNDRPAIASEALYKQALAYNKQAASAEYDQNTAAQAIATFTDFITLFPNDSRVPEAQKIIATLRTEQARGNFEIAKYYEKERRWNSAKIYYNEVVSLMLSDPNSPYAVQALERLDALNKRLQSASK
ncbi:MAG TPA: outer membrane protein assembly factor BamD, partial [Candidatus Paceibacterota bacterium]|nr:outer membrane protein assembly factor BamD [Candidatus Paceibacterota bacterium]